MSAPANTVELLAKGIVNFTRGKKSITILLVGETGTGRTSLLALLINVLAGRSLAEYDLQPYDLKNEMGVSDTQTQTIHAKLYEFYSVNGVKIAVLDTPGFADTRGLQRDEQHKDSIVTAIRDHISEVTAVIIVANGTTPRLGCTSDYAISTLTSILPRSLANNISIFFTHVSTPLAWSFDPDILPVELRHTKRFLLENPIAMRKKYLAVAQQEDLELLEELEKAVNQSHRTALKALVNMFNWLDTVQPEPTAEIILLYDQYMKIESDTSTILARMSQVSEKRNKLQNSISSLEAIRLTAKAYENILGVPEAQKRYDEAIWQLNMTEVQISAIQRDIDQITAEIAWSTSNIGTLAERYSELSLSGSFAVQLKKSVKLLEVHLQSTLAKGGDAETIKQIQASLEQLKTKLALLEQAAVAAKQKISNHAG